MKTFALTAQFRAEMDCSKEIVMWNYYDHEHLVGTHYKLYNKTRVLAEKGNWSLVYRSKRMPLPPLYTSGITFQYMDGNTMKSFHKDSIGFMLQMEAFFEDLPDDRCSVTVTYRIDTHPVSRALTAQPGKAGSSMRSRTSMGSPSGARVCGRNPKS
jgi:hypothetical protein